MCAQSRLDLLFTVMSPCCSYTAHLLRAMASGPRARQLAAAADGWQEAADDALALQVG
jgi:hypothetical protein